jgi:hypothetical protein
MSLSLSLFTLLISTALFITVLTPVILLLLLLRDWTKGDLW